MLFLFDNCIGGPLPTSKVVLDGRHPCSFNLKLILQCFYRCKHCYYHGVVLNYWTWVSPSLLLSNYVFVVSSALFSLGLQRILFKLALFYWFSDFQNPQYLPANSDVGTNWWVTSETMGDIYLNLGRLKILSMR